VHPGIVLIGLDGRVVLADARADGAAPEEEDVRAIGGLLYFALTGYWPHAEVAGPQPLPDAMRDPGGGLAAPRQVRAGVPDFLDNLTMDLLDRRLAVPAAEVLAGEFARLDAAPEERYYVEPAPEPMPEPMPERMDISAGPLRLSADPRAVAPKPSGRKILIGLAGLLVIGVVGLLVGLNWLTGSSSPPTEGTSGGGDPNATTPDAGEDPGEQEIGPIALAPEQVRIVDPPPGTRTELEGAEFVVDDNAETGWESETYQGAAFGNLKAGMGILINLGEPRNVALVRVELATAGATAELRVGEDDPGSTEDGDGQIEQTYQLIGEPQQGGATMSFNVDTAETHQYLMVWFTQLAPDGGGFRVDVRQVVVEGY